MIYELINQIKEEKQILFDLMEQHRNYQDNRSYLQKEIQTNFSSREELAHAINAQKNIITHLQEQIDLYNQIKQSRKEKRNV